MFLHPHTVYMTSSYNTIFSLIIVSKFFDKLNHRPSR